MRCRILTAVLLLLLCGVACGRLISHQPGLISDGVSASGVPRFIRLYASESCEMTYGFMPCTKTVLGNLFLICVYGYFLFLAATYLSSGSELLLQVVGPGIIGGLLIPMLGALPDALLILVSGISGSTATAQDEVSVGMGLLAGSTILLLSLIWGTCMVVGKCDIENSVATESKDTKRFSLTGSGVSVDVWTSYAGIITLVSVIPLLIVQFPQALNWDSGHNVAVLIALIVSASFLFSYCLYQIFQPAVQRRRLAYAKQKHVMSGVLKQLKTKAMGKLCRDDGKLDEDTLLKLFQRMDGDGDGYLQESELKALVLGIHFNDINLDEKTAVENLFKDFDSSRDSKIDASEFISGIKKWLEEAKDESSSQSGSTNYIDNFHEQTKREHDILGEQTEDSDEGAENSRPHTIKAVCLLLLGAVIAAAFADPLVDVVDNFSDATNIPTFFISFIVLPVATNSSEAVSAIIFASRKNLRSSSLTFSELYGAVTMNNTMCLSVFLAIVYIRGLTWDFSSEVLIILIVIIVMGGLASIRTTFPLWTCLLAFALYPLSLALVYVLDYIFGWT